MLINVWVWNVFGVSPIFLGGYACILIKSFFHPVEKYTVNCKLEKSAAISSSVRWNLGRAWIQFRRISRDMQRPLLRISTCSAILSSRQSWHLLIVFKREPFFWSHGFFKNKIPERASQKGRFLVLPADWKKTHICVLVPGSALSKQNCSEFFFPVVFIKTDFFNPDHQTSSKNYVWIFGKSDFSNFLLTRQPSWIGDWCFGPSPSGLWMYMHLQFFKSVQKCAHNGDKTVKRGGGGVFCPPGWVNVNQEGRGGPDPEVNYLAKTSQPPPLL